MRPPPPRRPGARHPRRSQCPARLPDESGSPATSAREAARACAPGAPPLPSLRPSPSPAARPEKGPAALGGESPIAPRPSRLSRLEGLPRATTYVKKSAAAPLSIRYPIHSEALRGRPPPPVWGEEREGKAGEVSEGLAPLTKKERRQHASTHSGFRQLAAQLQTHSPLRSGPFL